MTSIIFDLDGTLVDSLPDIAAALNNVMVAEGHEPFDSEAVKGFIGGGIPALAARAMEARAIPPSESERLTRAIRAVYTAEPATRTNVFFGVPMALVALQQAGHVLGVCTNKPEEPARAILDHLGLSPFFASILGAGRLPVIKPDPAPLYQVIADLGGGKAIFVGDSRIDAETARAAGVPFLLYTGGYRKEAVHDLPHDAAFGDFTRLPALIAGF